jgi:hypothetical protein
VSGRALGWAGLGAGAGVLGLVVTLFARVMRPVGEIDRYAADIHEAAVAIIGNLDGAGELARTRDLGAAVPELALAYLDRLGAGA